MPTCPGGTIPPFCIHGSQGTQRDLLFPKLKNPASIEGCNTSLSADPSTLPDGDCPSPSIETDLFLRVLHKPISGGECLGGQDPQQQGSGTCELPLSANGKQEDRIRQAAKDRANGTVSQATANRGKLYGQLTF